MKLLPALDTDQQAALGWCVGLAVLVIIFMWPALFPPPGMGLAGHDLLGQHIPWWQFVRARLLAGDLPLWNPHLFAGAPFLANPQLGFFYPAGWLAMLPRTEVGLAWMFAFHIWLAGTGMLFFTRQQGSSWGGAGLAAIAFAFSGFMGARLWAGHYYHFGSIALLPWLLFAYLWSVRRGDAWSGLAAGGVLALLIVVGFLPTLVYVAVLWGIFVLYLIIAGEGEGLPAPLPQRAGLAIRQAALVGIGGIALAAVMFLPALEYITQSVRSAGFDTIIGAMPPPHLITAAIPRFLGTSFLGDPIPYVLEIAVGGWHEMGIYTGILSLLALPLALRRPTRRTWLYLSVMVIGLVLAMGDSTPFAPLVYRLIPIFKLIRTAARASELYLIASCALLADAITHGGPLITAGEVRRFTRFMRGVVTGGVIGLALLTLALMRVLMRHAENPAAAQTLLNNALWGWAVASLLIVLAAGLLWALFTTPPAQPRRATLLTGALALLLIGDLWSFVRPALRLSPVEPPAFWVSAQELIPDDGFRLVAQIPVLEQTTMLPLDGLYNAYGYDGLVPTGSELLISAANRGGDAALDLLSVRYVVLKAEDAASPLRFTRGEEIGEANGVRVYRRETALPLARLVYEAQIEPPVDHDAPLVYMIDLDPARTVILEADPGCALGPPPADPGTATVTTHEAEFWRIRTSSDAPAILVLSELDYPGWQVTVDGAPAASLRAYAAIRAVCVPAGDHVVEWAFRPRIFVIGGAISGIALAALIVALWQIRRGRAAL